MTRSAVVFDTDMGTDDALALLLLRRVFDGSVYVVSCHGNVPEAVAADSAALVAAAVGLDGKVYRGAASPIGRQRVDASDVHGGDGLGGASVRLRAEYQAGLPPPALFADLLTSGALTRHRRVHWITVGPATNLARLADEQPTLFHALASVTIMSGVFLDVGNVTRWAEFNAYSDAIALSRVLASGRPLRIVPLDVCRKVQLRFDDIETAFDDEPPALAAAMREAHANYCGNYRQWEGFHGCFPHDSVAMLAALYPEAFYTVRRRASCVEAGQKVGQTTWELSGDGPHDVVMGGKLKAVRESILSLGRQLPIGQSEATLRRIA